MKKYEKFINKLSKANKDFDYDYSETKYGSSLDVINVTCNKHGKFSKTVQQLKRGSGCPICIKEKTKHKNKISFLVKAEKLHNNKYSYKKVDYHTNRKLVTIVCPEHGDFQQTPSNHLKGHGCKKCQYIEVSKKNSKTTEQFIEEAKLVHNNVYDYSLTDYVNSCTKVKIILPSGQVAEQLPSHHLSGYRPGLDDRGLDYDRPAILYYLKVTTNSSVFYKIGITTKSVEERFKLADLKKIEVISLEKFTTARDAFNKEQNILKKYSKYRYHGPDILESAGNTELFSVDVLNSKELKDEIIAMGE